MADNNDSGNELVPFVKENKAMKLKWIEARKQELKSAIVRGKQEIEDLRIAKVADIELRIMHAEESLRQLKQNESRLNALEVKEVK